MSVLEFFKQLLSVSSKLLKYQMSDKSKNKKHQQKGKSHRGGDKTFKEDVQQQKKPYNENQKEKQLDRFPEKQAIKVEEVHSDPLQFANLKRETDEILKIMEGNKSKYSKREITSNWTKYELPADNYDIVENQEQQGANFEELLQMPASQGGHFQFKHEKDWINTNVNNDYKQLFTLNLNYIASALHCLPFHERNDLDPELFSNEQLERMTSTAEKNMKKFRKNLPIEKIEKTIAKDLLDKLKEPTNSQTQQIDKSKDDVMFVEREMCEDDAEDDELEKMLVGSLVTPSLSDNKEMKNDSPISGDDTSMYDFTSSDLMLDSSQTTHGLIISKVPSEPVVKATMRIVHHVEDGDNELDEILGIKSENTNKKAEDNKLNVQPVVSKPVLKSTPTAPVQETKMDLDKWLDDYLDS